MNPWRAALNWHLGVFVLGSLAATILTVPCLIGLVLVYDGQNPFLWKSGRIAICFMQICQSLVIGLVGGALTLRYFRRRISVTYDQIRQPMIVTAGFIAALPVVLGIAIALSKYGPTPHMMLTASLIFGIFMICFLCGSFHFAHKLEGQSNRSEP